MRIGLAGKQIICVALGTLGLFTALHTCILPSWMVSLQEMYAGLWMKCENKSMGQECKTWDLVPGMRIQAIRGMTVTCCVLAAISLLVFITSIKKDIMPKMSLAAGVGMLVAGLQLIISVSWAANIIINEFPSYCKFGLCIYVGWSGGVLLLLGGGLLCDLSRPSCSSFGSTAKDNSGAEV